MLVDEVGLSVSFWTVVIFNVVKWFEPRYYIKNWTIRKVNDSDMVKYPNYMVDDVKLLI